MSNRSDNFNRADTTSGLGTPSDGGSAWSPDDATPWGINTNRAYFTFSLTSANQLEASTAVATAQVTLQTYEADNGIVGRANGAGNYILGVWRSAGNTAQVYSVSGGTYTSLATGTATWANGDVAALDIDSSNNIVLSQNGTARVTTSSAVGSTNTRWGIWANGAGAMRWDDFSVTDNAATGSALSAAGSATTTGTGAALASASASAAGVANATLGGGAIANASLNAAGSATAQFEGTADAGASAALSSAGATTVNFEGGSVAAGALSADGSATATFDSTEADTGIDVTLWGRLRQDARLRAQIEQEDADVIRIIRTHIAPEILRRRRMH